MCNYLPLWSSCTVVKLKLCRHRLMLQDSFILNGRATEIDKTVDVGSQTFAACFKTEQHGMLWAISLTLVGTWYKAGLIKPSAGLALSIV